MKCLCKTHYSGVGGIDKTSWYYLNFLMNHLNLKNNDSASNPCTETFRKLYRDKWQIDKLYKGASVCTMCPICSQSVQWNGTDGGLLSPLKQLFWCLLCCDWISAINFLKARPSLEILSDLLLSKLVLLSPFSLPLSHPLSLSVSLSPPFALSFLTFSHCLGHAVPVSLSLFLSVSLSVSLPVTLSLSLSVPVSLPVSHSVSLSPSLTHKLYSLSCSPFCSLSLGVSRSCHLRKRENSLQEMIVFPLGSFPSLCPLLLSSPPLFAHRCINLPLSLPDLS